MRLMRSLGPALLIINVTISSFTNSPWNELLLYTSIGVVGLLSILLNPVKRDKQSKNLILAGISMWVMGSIIASLSLKFEIPQLITSGSDLLYLLFYPFMLLGASQMLGLRHVNKLLDSVDSLIISLGITTLGTALILQPVLPHFDGDFRKSFFAIFYPIADLVLVSVVLTSLATQGFSRRGVLFSLGIVVYAISDFLFLWLSVHSDYVIGSFIDAGWLFGILLISESFWHDGVDSIVREVTSPILISIAVFLSATLLVIIALAPDYLPHFILIPAISTLALAFSRMAIALNQARHIGQERLLARTDELTGLPNRRRLISEIAEFKLKEGSLLLLDLDGFKPVNDRYGHEIGDKVLQQVALRFDRALSSRALLARLGGDEFGVLYEGEQESAIEMALALRATLSYPFHIENKEIKLGVSIGVAKNNGDDDLLRRADNAMYTAKREGLGVYPL